MAFGEHAVGFAFTAERFDHSAELPADANAGNRFYGRDVAEFLSDGLGRRGLDASFFDEDWGWQVHALRADGVVLEVSIYHNPDEDPATPDDWALMLRALRRKRIRVREVELDDDAVAAVEAVFGDAGIELRRAPARSSRA